MDFQLDHNENLDQLCGEIFLTTKGNIAMQCTLCDVVYKNFEKFTEHLNKQHISAENEDYDNGSSIEETEEISIEEYHIEPSINELEFMVEDEIPLDHAEISNLVKIEENDEREMQENELSTEQVQSTEVIIPNQYRSVNKRTIKGPFEASSEERKYKCVICGLAFKEKHNMEYHMKRHSVQKNYKCPECEKMFYTPSEVRIHLRSHTNRKKYSCNYCGCSFPKSLQLAVHIKTHTEKQDFTCEICHKSFFEKDTLKQHIMYHSSERMFEDDIIETVEISKLSENEKKAFQSSKNKYSNIHEDPIETVEISKLTEIEDKEDIRSSESKDSTNVELLKNFNIIRSVHKRISKKPSVIATEERKHQCPICGLAFKEKHNMNYHFKRHSNQKEHACTECEKRFHTQSEVRIHMRSHTREKKFLCSDCGSSFFTTTLLRNHIKRHTNQRDFKCGLCDKSFFERHNLEGHMRSHSLEKPFKCKVCEARFSTRSILRNHMRLHENKRKYTCNIFPCEASFNQKAGLFSHKKTCHKVM